MALSLLLDFMFRRWRSCFSSFTYYLKDLVRKPRLGCLNLPYGTDVNLEYQIYERITRECPENPEGGPVEQCPKHKLHNSGSSRQKKALPGWASRN